MILKFDQTSGHEWTGRFKSMVGDDEWFPWQDRVVSDWSLYFYCSMIFSVSIFFVDMHSRCFNAFSLLGLLAQTAWPFSVAVTSKSRWLSAVHEEYDPVTQSFARDLWCWDRPFYDGRLGWHDASILILCEQKLESNSRPSSKLVFCRFLQTIFLWNSNLAHRKCTIPKSDRICTFTPKRHRRKRLKAK